MLPSEDFELRDRISQERRDKADVIRQKRMFFLRDPEENFPETPGGQSIIRDEKIAALPNKLSDLKTQT